MAAQNDEHQWAAAMRRGDLETAWSIKDAELQRRLREGPFIGSTCPGIYNRYGAANRWPENVSWCAVIMVSAIRFSSSDFFNL